MKSFNLTVFTAFLICMAIHTEMTCALKCYQGVGAVRKEKECGDNDTSCSSHNYKGIAYLDCSTEKGDGCEDNVDVEVAGLTVAVRQCHCDQDLCNEADVKSAQLTLALASVGLLVGLGARLV